MKKTMTKLFVFLLSALLCACEKKHQELINLNDYIAVSFSGYNHAGYASVKFDKEQFMLDHIDNVAFDKKNKAVYDELYGNDGKSPVNSLCKFFSVGFENYENLENGDAVRLVWKLNEEKISTYFDCEYIFSNDEYLVSGLVEADTFDPFSEISISFSGIAPYGSVKLAAYDFHGGTYSVSPQENLSNGDIVTVTYLCDDVNQMIANYGTYPSVYEKTYEVSGLKEFLQSEEDISDDIWKQIDHAAEKYFNNFAEEEFYGMEVKCYTRVGSAYVIPVVNLDWTSPSLYVVYHVNADAVNKNMAGVRQIKSTEYYVVFVFTELLIENDVCTLKTTDYTIASHTTQGIEFGDSPNITTYVRADGFNTTEEIDEYLSNRLSDRTKLVFQTYK